MTKEPQTTPCFVLYRQPSEGKAEIIYVGNDKGAAFDAIMAYGNYCQIDELLPCSYYGMNLKQVKKFQISN